MFQKMEIKTETDDIDEGVPLKNTSNGHFNKWTSPKIRKKIKSVLSFSHKANNT